jgi:hypothetical protein
VPPFATLHTVVKPVSPAFPISAYGTLLASIRIAMAKVLSNGRLWGSGSRVPPPTREQIIRLLKSSDLPIRMIALRYGVSAEVVSAINASENYIRPKGHRPERM